MSGCPTDEELAAFGADVIHQDAAGRVASHVALCERCAHRLAEAREDDALLARMRGALGGDFRSRPATDASQSAQHIGFPKIEGYILLAELGRGGMGIVYRATQTALGREVALKILPAHVSALKRDSIDRFRREAAAAGKLHHHNIIPIYDFGTSRGVYYYAMELIDGRPLDEVIESVAAHPQSIHSARALSQILFKVAPEPESSDSGRTKPGSSSSILGRFYFRQVAQWIAEVADALDYAHDRGVVHRDIKPSNLILSREGRLMLGDFGLAKLADEASVTMTGSLLGTVRYLSPEQAVAGRIRVDHRTDIYSLGATMYELLCFRQAFPGAEQSHVLQAIIAKEPTAPRKILPQVPVELETICLKALEKHPAARYSAARELAEDLRRFCNDLPIVARRPGPIRRLRKFVRRHRVPTLAALLGFISIATSIGFLYEKRIAIVWRKYRVENLEDEAEDYAKVRQWGLVDTAYDSALRIGGENAVILGSYARLKAEQFKEEHQLEALDSMKRLCDRAMELEPTKPDLWNLRGGYHKLMGDHLLESGDSLRARDNYRQAGVWWGQLTKADPDRPSAWNNLAIVSVLDGDLKAALNYLQRAVQTQAPSALKCDSWRQLASVQLALGDCASAGVSVKAGEECSRKPRSDDMNPHLAEALLLRSRIRLDQALSGDIDALKDAEYFARAADDEAIKAIPQKIKATRARIALLLGDANAAVARAKEALELHDSLPCMDYLILASAYAKLGNESDAQSAFDEAIRVWPPALRETPYIVSAPDGVLWIDRAEDLEQFRRDVEIQLKRGREPRSELHP